MVLQMAGNQPNAIRALQHFIDQRAWDDEALLAQHWREVTQDLGEDDGCAILLLQLSRRLFILFIS